jgi:Flp pilus assembly protein TadD
VRNRDWHDTTTLFWAALDAYPGSARVQGGIGKQLMREGRPTEALEYLRRAIRIFPNSPSVYNDLGLTYAALGALEDAEQAAQTATSLSPGNPMFHQNLAHFRSLRGVHNPVAPERSLDELLKAVEQQPDDFETRYQLGLAHVQAGDLPKAVVALERATELDPKRADARLDYAMQLFATERQDEAFEQFQKVLDIDPDNWRAHTNLAVCLALRRDFDAALRHAEKARDLARDQFQAWMNLAQVHVHAERFDEAMELYQRIRSGLPENDANRAIVDGCIDELNRTRRRMGR